MGGEAETTVTGGAHMRASGDDTLRDDTPLTVSTLTPAPASASTPPAMTVPHASGSSQSVTSETPVVSVVIPAYNSADTLGACLDSLAAQGYPRERFEVIVVDDGSTDETIVIARTSPVALSGRFTVVSQANAGPAAARNAGIRAAVGRIVALTDADCVAAPDWLESLVRAFDDHPGVAGVGGPLRNAAPSDTTIARYLLAADFYRHRTRGETVEYLLTANAAFLRSALLDIGGFTERKRAWAEDADLSFRLVQSGYMLLLSQEGTVTHSGVLESGRDFVRGLYRYGFGNAVLARGWPARRRPGLQLIRHAGAAILAPWLAWRLRHQVGWRDALTFCPVIVVEHVAYSAGLIGGAIAGIRGEHQGRSTSGE